MTLPKVSVVIRNKNQYQELAFLLKNLTERYIEDIDEVIVLDNLSTDKSKEITKKYKVKFISIPEFGYGSSANLAAQSASNNIVVIFSAHSYPISWDFFKLIKCKFSEDPLIAGIRCLHTDSDYKNFINSISANENPNTSGLIFCGSAFNKKIWKKEPFKEDIVTFEDKEWTKRVINNGYKVEFCPSIFCYSISRSKKQLFFRYKNEIIGGYKLWGTDISFKLFVKNALISYLSIWKNLIVDLYYWGKRILFLLKFLINKPSKY